MPAKRLSMRKVREVLRLKWAGGLSNRTRPDKEHSHEDPDYFLKSPSGPDNFNATIPLLPVSKNNPGTAGTQRKAGLRNGPWQR
jgi:hypothetical protein